MAGRDLDAAGITDPALRASYERCRRLNAEHGKTYYLATLLLPPEKRPYVHALYGFARYADDIVDDLDPGASATDRSERFHQWSEDFLTDLDWGSSGDPVGRAIIDTVARWQIPLGYLADFLDSMRSDLTVTEYDTFGDLSRYMWGSAAVIGLEMLPILGRADEMTPWNVLEAPAIDLGQAFQLTNFIRDMGEDLDRGRVYLPQESLRKFGLDRAHLLRAHRVRQVDAPIRQLLAAEIDRARGLYRRAEPGIALVHPTSRDCLRTALTLYREILDAVERADYQVFRGRVSVSTRRRAQVGGQGLLGAFRARRRHSVDAPATPSLRASARPGRNRITRPRLGRRRSVDR
ncbi:MAG: phytoene/squalene synthase family protein [Actinomycetota bacterium]